MFLSYPWNCDIETEANVPVGSESDAMDSTYILSCVPAQVNFSEISFLVSLMEYIWVLIST